MFRNLFCSFALPTSEEQQVQHDVKLHGGRWLYSDLCLWSHSTFKIWTQAAEIHSPDSKIKTKKDCDQKVDYRKHAYQMFESQEMYFKDKIGCLNWKKQHVSEELDRKIFASV